MQTKAENIIDFPLNLRRDMRTVADNMENASENLKRSAEILQLRANFPLLVQDPRWTVEDALVKAQELRSSAKSLNEKINLLRSNLLK